MTFFDFRFWPFAFSYCNFSTRMFTDLILKFSKRITRNATTPYLAETKLSDAISTPPKIISISQKVVGIPKKARLWPFQGGSKQFIDMQGTSQNCADMDVKLQGSCISRIHAKRMQSPATAADSRCRRPLKPGEPWVRRSPPAARAKRRRRYPRFGLTLS